MHLHVDLMEGMSKRNSNDHRRRHQQPCHIALATTLLHRCRSRCSGLILLTVFLQISNACQKWKFLYYTSKHRSSNWTLWKCYCFRKCSCIVLQQNGSPLSLIIKSKPSEGSFSRQWQMNSLYGTLEKLQRTCTFLNEINEPMNKFLQIWQLL